MLRKLKIIKLFLVILLASYMFYGCGPFFSQPLAPEKARLGPETPQYTELTSLPEPKEMLVAAVYKFSDQTGQYKPSLANSWSTAITQGATSILQRALEESKWFIVIERENLGNLLNERKIIRSSRAQYLGTDEGILLPPLLFAGIILEGGIISYESNIRTGGIGARYFGVGASGQYREDRVTVYLRAVSTSNGKILKTVYTTKSILSQEISANFFRYVDFKRLLEGEIGFTYNEPTEMAVTEAIEKAIVSLVLEGVRDKLWEFKSPADTANIVYKNYLKEEKENINIDQFGRYLTEDIRGQFGLGLYYGGLLYEGDYKNSVWKQYFEFNADWYFKPKFALNLNVGHGEFEASGYLQTIDYAELNLKYLFMPKWKFSPFLYFGGGAILDEKDKYTVCAKAQAGLGLEYVVAKRLGIQVLGNYSYMFSDELDGYDIGQYNDFYWGLSIGLKYYFGKPPLLRNLKK
jgi:curli production assembly/transport component CsgG